MNGLEVINRLKQLRVPHDRIAEAIGRNRVAATRLLNGQRQLKADEIAPLNKLLDEVTQRPPGEGELSSYLRVDVLPTYAGMGGGGFPDNDDTESLLVPRSLLEDYLRGKAQDFLVVNVRGDSMEPDFRHGDQIIIDRRDINPVQPGPFALMMDGSYVLKNVQKLRDSFRVFSSNQKYSDESFDEEQLQIIGRPVWFARKL